MLEDEFYLSLLECFLKTVGRSAPLSLYIYDCNLTPALVTDRFRDGEMRTSIMAGKDSFSSLHSFYFSKGLRLGRSLLFMFDT